MQQAIAEFLGQLADRNRARLKVRRYGEVLARFAAFCRAELRRDDVAPGEVDKALVVAFVREGASAGLRPGPATRNARLATLRSFFRFLVADGRIGRDPAAGVPFSRIPVSTPAFLTGGEFGRLVAAIEAGATEHYLRRDLALVTTFWHTGLRLGELASLDLAQADFAAERFVRVRRKGGDVVDVHFNVEVTIALRRWLPVRGLYRNSAGQPALFLSDRGTRLAPRSIEDLVGKYARAAELGKRVTPHALRHSTATELVRRGNPIEVVADVLNHKNLNTTRRYVHIVGAQVHAAVASLAEPLADGA